MISVLVAHPGTQHSDRLVAELEAPLRLAPTCFAAGAREPRARAFSIAPNWLRKGATN